jgi:hypothetical protein
MAPYPLSQSLHHMTLHHIKSHLATKMRTVAIFPNHRTQVETCLDLQLRPMDCPDAPDFALARRRAAGAGSVGESYLNACRRDVKIPPLGQARSAASRPNIAPPPGPARPAARGAAAAARGVGVKVGEWAAGCWQGLAVAAAAAVLMACLAALGRCPDEHKGGGHQRPLLA